MIENIKNLATNQNLKTSDNSNNKNIANSTSNSSDTNTAAVTSGSDGVQLSAEAQKLESIKKNIMSAPDIDQAKVDQIKESIANGDYKVNFSNLADKMINSFANKG